MRCSIDLRTMRTVVYPPMASDAPPGPSCVQLYTCSPLYAFGRYTDATRFVSCDAKSGVRTLMLCYHSRSKQRIDQMVLNNTSTYAQIFSRKKYFPNFFLTFVQLYSMQLFSADPTIFTKNKPERVFSLQVRWRELDTFKILEIFWEIVWKLFVFFWNSLGIFFGGFFWGIFCWDIFLEKIFGRIFFGRIFLGGFFMRNFWEEFFGRN